MDKKRRGLRVLKEHVIQLYTWSLVIMCMLIYSTYIHSSDRMEGIMEFVG